jgi:hypothetical protein
MFSVVTNVLHEDRAIDLARVCSAVCMRRAVSL